MNAFPTIDFSQLQLQDALDYAILIEEEARLRYQDFADRLGHRYEGDAASFFDAMVVNEQKHRAALERRRRELFGHAQSRVDPDAIVDVEAPATHLPRNFMSTRQALTIALAAEQKAYDFFDQALATVRDAEVRELFLELRQEELGHQQLVAELLARTAEDANADRSWDEIDTPTL